MKRKEAKAPKDVFHSMVAIVDKLAKAPMRTFVVGGWWYDGGRKFSVHPLCYAAGLFDPDEISMLHQTGDSNLFSRIADRLGLPCDAVEAWEKYYRLRGGGRQIGVITRAETVDALTGAAVDLRKEIYKSGD